MGRIRIRIVLFGKKYSNIRIIRIFVSTLAPTSDDLRSSLCLDRRRSEGFVSDFVGSPSRGEILREEYPQVKAGMENVPQWLKQLRLHKYTELMMNLSYQ